MDNLDLQSLRLAKGLLEKPGLTARITNTLGMPIEKGLQKLPDKVRSSVHKAAEKSIAVAFDVASSTFPGQTSITQSNNFVHKVAVAGTGGLGGFFGPLALFIELPLSATLMMRSIIDVAQSEGEDIRNPETKLACLQVFAFGGPSEKDDAAGSGYIMTRAALARTFADASRVLLGREAAQESAGVIAKVIASVAARFQVIVSEKVAAQLVPLIGAAGGAGINVLFMDHFQGIARGHFIVRRLEKKYGVEEVQRQYLEMKI